MCQVLSRSCHPPTLCFRKHEANKLDNQTAKLHFHSFMAGALVLPAGVRGGRVQGPDHPNIRLLYFTVTQCLGLYTSLYWKPAIK